MYTSKIMTKPLQKSSHLVNLFQSSNCTRPSFIHPWPFRHTELILLPLLQQWKQHANKQQQNPLPHLKDSRMFVSLRMKRGKVGKLPTWIFKGDEVRQWRVGHTTYTHWPHTRGRWSKLKSEPGVSEHSWEQYMIFWNNGSKSKWVVIMLNIYGFKKQSFPSELLVNQPSNSKRGFMSLS